MFSSTALDSDNKTRPKISPNENDITVSPGSDLTLKCTANYPIKWIGKMIIDEFLDWRNDSIYESSLTLRNINYKSVGFLYCAEAISEDYEGSKSSSIYLFVDDPVNVMVPIKSKILRLNKDMKLLLPCKPTSKKYVAEVTFSGFNISIINYDPKYGSSVMVPDIIIYLRSENYQWNCIVGNHSKTFHSIIKCK